MKHFLTINDCSKDDIIKLLNTADQLKYEHKHNIPHKILEGKTLGMIFSQVSTRTRVSFEVGMYQLGGMAIFLPSDALQITKGEPISDTARVLSCYLDAVMVRTKSQSELEEYASHSEIPVINGLTDLWNPCQAIADLMTIREKKVSFKGLKIAYIGRGNNNANSLISGCLKLGIKINVACPRTFEPTDSVVKNGLQTGLLEFSHDPRDAVSGADVIYAGKWHNLDEIYDGDERRKAFEGYTLDRNLISLAKENVLVLHSLPAHRGLEITDDVFEEHADDIFTQTENRLHAQKAILSSLMR